MSKTRILSDLRFEIFCFCSTFRYSSPVTNAIAGIPKNANSLNELRPARVIINPADLMILWEGDEEFPPSSQILFSDNFPVSFQAEDMAVMGDVIIGSLKAYLKCVQK